MLCGSFSKLFREQKEEESMRKIKYNYYNIKVLAKKLSIYDLAEKGRTLLSPASEYCIEKSTVHDCKMDNVDNWHCACVSYESFIEGGMD